MFDKIHLWSYLVLDFCWQNHFNHSFNYILMIGMFIFSISFWFNLGRFYLRICPIILGFPFYWHIVAWSSLDSLYFFGVCCNFFFISNVNDLSPLLFFLISLTKSIYQFCLPAQRIRLKFHWYFSLCSCLYFISSAWYLWFLFFYYCLFFSL